MSQFRFTCRNSYAERYTEVQVEAETLDDVIVNFEEFLRGCGYYFDGTLQLIDEAPAPVWGEQLPDFPPVVDSEGGIE